MKTEIVLGVILLIIGLTLRYLIGRRRFNRRNAAGIPQFSSYGLAVVITCIEKILDVLGFLFFLAGLGLTIIGVYIF